MLTLHFPADVPAALNDDGSVKDDALIGADTIRDAVLSLPFWREGSDLKRLDAFLEIEAALDLDPAAPCVSTETRNLLKDAMQLRMPNGNFVTINNARANRFYMRLFRAVLVATEEKPAPNVSP